MPSLMPAVVNSSEPVCKLYEAGHEPWAKGTVARNVSDKKNTC